MERIVQTISLHSIKKKQEKITLGKISFFQVSESWCWNNQVRFLECLRSVGKILQWKQLSLVNDEEVISLSHAKVHVLSDYSVCVLKRWIRTQDQILFGISSWIGSKIHHNTERWTQLTKNLWNSEWMIFFTIHYIAVRPRSPEAHEQNGRVKTTPRTNYLHVDVQKTSHGELKTLKRNVLLIPHLCLYFAQNFPAGHWSFLGPGPETKRHPCFTTKDHKENGTMSQHWLMIKFGESGHPVVWAMCPLSRGTIRSEGGVFFFSHLCADGDTFETVLLTITSVNKLSFYGAVSNVCEEYGSCRTRTGRHVVAEQSDPTVRGSKLLDNDI